MLRGLVKHEMGTKIPRASNSEMDDCMGIFNSVTAVLQAINLPQNVCIGVCVYFPWEVAVIFT